MIMIKMCIKELDLSFILNSPRLVPRANTEINLGGCKIWTVNSKNLASWISGISIRYFKGTHSVQSPCKYYFISLSNKTSRKKNIFSKNLAFREATTGSCSVLLKVLRDTGWERENGKPEKL